jgi:hypothetical protein
VKVVINTAIGGFDFSIAMMKRLIDEGAACVDVQDLFLATGLNLRPSDTWADLGDGYKMWRRTLSGSMVVKDDKLYTVDLHKASVRSDPTFVRVLEELGDAAQVPGRGSNLQIIEIPDGVEFDVCVVDDGREWIAEKHRTWGDS